MIARVQQGTVDAPELHLPREILAKAVMSGGESGWRRGDVLEAVRSAPSVGLAVLGGQVQFLLPDGTCELYWLDYDPSGRHRTEPFPAYAGRSSGETTAALQRVLAMDLVDEGVTSFKHLQRAEAQGVLLEDCLLFIVYFATAEEAGEANTGDRRPNQGRTR